MFPNNVGCLLYVDTRLTFETLTKCKKAYVLLQMLEEQQQITRFKLQVSACISECVH